MLRRATGTLFAGAVCASFVAPSRSFSASRITQVPGSPSSAPATPRPVQVLATSSCIGKIVPDPRPRASWKLCNCGDDAYYVGVHATHATIAVADGVGGWGDCADEFSNMLMRNLKPHDVPNTSAIEQLSGAYVQCVKDRARASTTACVSHIDCTSGKFSIANVGDSGFMIFRNGAKMYSSEPMQVRFNMPYQLGAHANAHTPNDARLYTGDFIPGDIMVLYTDGVTDTLSEDDLARAVTTFLQMHPLYAHVFLLF